MFKSIRQATSKNIYSVGFFTIALATVLGAVAYGASHYRAHLHELQEETSHYADHVEHLIRTELTDKEFLARGLAVALEVSGELTQNAFSKIVTNLKSLAPYIINVALVVDYSLEMVHPLEENASLLGRNLSNFPEQRDAIARALESGQPVFDGPVQLLQGTSGFILRVPVDLSGGALAGSRDDAVLSVVLDADRLFLEAGLSNHSDDYDLSIHAIDETGRAISLVYGTEKTSSKTTVTVDLKIPGGLWRIGVTPKPGRAAGYAFPFLPLLIIFSIGGFAAFVVSDAKKEAAARKVLQSRLTTAIESLNDAFVLYDADDRLVLCNKRYLEIYRESAAAMVPGTPFEDILRYGLKNGQYAEAIGREDEWLAERLAAHARSDSVIEQKLKNGRVLRVVDRKTQDGGRVGLRIDITEQIESRHRAEQAEQRLRDAIEALPAGFWLLDKDNKLVMFNQFYLDLYEASAPAVKIGATSEEILRYGLENGEYPEAVGREEEWLQGLYENLASENFEWEYPLKNGRWIKSIKRCTSDGGRVGIRVDVTAEKTQQIELEKKNAELSDALIQRDEAYKRFYDIAEISTDWFWEQDKDFRFTYLSEGFDKQTDGLSRLLMGKTRKECFGKNISTVESADWVALETKMAAHQPFGNFVYCVENPAGGSRWFRISGTPIFDKDGEFDGYRGVGTDVSVLHQALQNAERANQSKTDFLNTFSHELRTPLTIILGYMAFLKDPDQLPSFKTLKENVQSPTGDIGKARNSLESATNDIVKFAKKSDDAGRHLLELINDILDMSKIESGSMDMHLKDIPLKTFLRSFAEKFEIEARKKGLYLYCYSDDCTIRADEIRLKQILFNLLGNALKFTDKGLLTLRAKARDGEAHISVEDTGCGIAEDMQETVFESFRQADGAGYRAAAGTGLGLTISRQLAALQGGRIGLKSTPGAGSTFTLCLPLSTSDSAKAGDAKSRNAV